LRVAEFMGTVEERTPHFWRKVRYAYMDARRYANAQGLTMKGPRRIYDAFYSSAGMLFAQAHGLFRPYHDTVFRRFWSHDLEIDELSDIAGVIASVGGAPKNPAWYLNLQGRDAEVQAGRERTSVRARDAEGEERDRLWAQMVALYPSYDEYQTKTTRRIPVVVLEAVGS